MVSKSSKKVVIVGGIVGAGILALAGTALALRAKSQPPAVVRVVGAAPADNLTIYLIADSSLLYAKVGNWQSAKVGMWDSMIDDVYARKSEWATQTGDWTNIYDDLLQLKLSYCNEFGIPYSTEQRNRDMEIRNQRVVSSAPNQPAMGGGGGATGSGINAGNTNPFAVSIGSGVKAATVAQYGCLANASAPSVVDNVNIGTYPFENYRGFISKTIGMDWWGPKIRYPFYGQTVYVQPKFSSTSTPEQHIISNKKLGVNLWGWESGMYPAANLAGLINEVRRYEGVWNAKCPQNPRGCATIGGANDFYAQLAQALNHYVANV